MPALAVNWRREMIALGTNTVTRPFDPASLVESIDWKQSAIDPILEAINNAGPTAATQVSVTAREAARAVLNLLASFADPEIAIDENEITLEWYKDRHHVAVLALD